MRVHHRISLVVQSLIYFLLTTISTPTIVRAENVPAPASTQTGVIDDSAPGWIWRSMDAIDDAGFDGGSAHAGGPSAYCAYTFHGTGVEVVGMGGSSIVVGGRAHKLGKASISIDGKTQSVVSPQRGTTEYGVSLVQLTGLPDTNHVLEITADSGWIVVDCIKVASTFSGKPAERLPTVIQDGDYRLHPRHAPEKCLEAAAPVLAPGMEIAIDHFDPDRPQVWHIKPLGNGQYLVTPAGDSNLVLTLTPPNPQDGAPLVRLWQNVADPTQHLTFTQTENGYYRIAPSTNASVVLDVLKLGTVDGTQVITFGWWASPNQQWGLEPVKRDHANSK